MARIKIILSDPQVLFREGIHFVLSGEEDFEVIGETTSNQDALDYIETNEPNIAILSMSDRDLTGSEATGRLKRRFPSLSVILIMDKTDDDQVFSAIESGASSCLSKDTDPEELLNVIRVVAQGSHPIVDTLLKPEIASRSLARYKDMETLDRQIGNLLAGLSNKESEILTDIAAGNSIEQINLKLSINEEAVRNSLRQIINKLVANDQTRAIIEATQRSLPIILGSNPGANVSTAEYVSKEEFTRFKESLMLRLKNLIGETV